MARILPLRNAEVTTFPHGDRRDVAMRSLDDFARDKLTALECRRPAAQPGSKPPGRVSGPCGRAENCFHFPATIIST